MLLFFCGNEGDVAVFANFSRLLLDWAADPRIQGQGGKVSVVYAEHRFYGRSMPANPGALRKFLTVEQALEDYASLIRHLTGDRDGTKVVSVGGSYGGMLSAWLRARHPDVVDAALASSAPLHFDRVGPSFFRLVTEAAEHASPGCPALVQAGFAAVLAAPTDALVQAFGLCPGSLEHVGVDGFVLWARTALVTLAMGNYPHACDLFGKGLPAFPLAEACRAGGETTAAARARAGARAGDDGAIEGLAATVRFYYNASGSVRCHDIAAEYRACADQTGCGGAAASWGLSWDYEACTEIVYYTSTDNRTDAFPPRRWGPVELDRYCRATWGVTPRPQWYKPWLARVEQRASRIVFSNGDQDPWRGGGVTFPVARDGGDQGALTSVTVPGGAHILDLAGHRADDPPALTAARSAITETIARWIHGGNP